MSCAAGEDRSPGDSGGIDAAVARDGAADTSSEPPCDAGHYTLTITASGPVYFGSSEALSFEVMRRPLRITAPDAQLPAGDPLPALILSPQSRGALSKTAGRISS